MKKILFIIALAVSSTSFAQRSIWTFSYPISFAVGEQADFIANTSFRGFGIDGRSFITDNISVGGSWSWEVFNEIKRDLPPTQVTIEDVDNVIGHISGTQYRYLNTMPLMVNGHFYLGENGSVRPYFGLSLGTSYVEERTDIGMVSLVTDKWRFAFQPEIGAFIPFGLSEGGANIAAKFRYSTKAGEGTIPVSFFTLSVGLSVIK
ncbi:MAG: outer membrane beta-barrel protein [Bacteroidota bacterium]